MNESTKQPEIELRDRVVASGGELELTTRELYREFGYDGRDAGEREAVSTLLDSAHLEVTSSGRGHVLLQSRTDPTEELEPTELVPASAAVVPGNAPASVPPAAPPAAPGTVIQQQVFVGQRKSVGLAIFLAFLFGPLGLLYASVTGGVIMLVTALVGGFFVGVLGALTLGAGLALFIPLAIIIDLICMIWAGVAASNHNSRLSSQAIQTVGQPYAAVPAPAQLPPAAGWYPDPSGSGQRYWDGAVWTEHRAQ